MELLQTEDPGQSRSHFMIPGTALCYCECTAETITCPQMLLAVSETEWQAEGAAFPVRTMLCFLYPADLTEAEFGLLKYLIGLILNDKEIQSALEGKQEDVIREVLAGRIRTYLAELL